MKRTLLYVRRPQFKQGIECSLALEHKHQHHFLSLSLSHFLAASPSLFRTSSAMLPANNH